MKKPRDKLVRVTDFDNHETAFLEIKLPDKFHNNQALENLMKISRKQIKFGYQYFILNDFSLCFDQS